MLAKKKLSITTKLKRLGACEEAVTFSKGFKSAQTAWDACERGDWMLWLIGRKITCAPWTDGRKKILACAMDCAETAKNLWPAAKRDAIAGHMTTLRRWIKGKATTDEAIEARQGLHDGGGTAAAGDIYADAACDAVGAVAGDDVHESAYYAVAYYAVAYAAAAYGAGPKEAGRIKILKRCAVIVRKHFPKPPK